MNLFFKNLPIYFINLEKRKDRLNYIVDHFSKNQVKDFYRVAAIDGNTIKNNTSLSSSELGCVLSHIKAIEDFYNSDNEFAMICEDDLNLSNSLKIKFNFLETLEHYNNDQYCLQVTVSTREEMLINFNMHRRTFWDFSTVGYIINKKYAKTILDKYSYKDLSTLNNFAAQDIIDPRGGTINTRPVADELVYSETSVMVWPVFTFENTESNININDESFRQVSHSINLFNRRWKKKNEILIDDFMGKIE